MAMLIFVPYMTLIVLDLIVYIWRVFIDEWKVTINLLKKFINKTTVEQVKKVQWLVNQYYYQFHLLMGYFLHFMIDWLIHSSSAINWVILFLLFCRFYHRNLFTLYHFIALFLYYIIFLLLYYFILNYSIIFFFT